MSHIVLTDEQVSVLTAAGGTVEVRDPQGRTIAQLSALEAAEIEAIERWKRRAPYTGPLITSEQVQAHLRRLEEIRRNEGLDEEKMVQLLRRMQAGEQA